LHLGLIIDTPYRSPIHSFLSNMLFTAAQQLKDIGTFIGLEGTDLFNFVREQQKLEREERDKERKNKEKSIGRTKKGKRESIKKKN